MIKTLKHLGLTDKEIQLYELLKNFGELSISHISNSLNIGHSSAGYLCSSLRDKKMAIRTSRGGGAYYAPEPLKKAVDLLKLHSDEARIELMEHNLSNQQIPHVFAVSAEKEVLDLYKRFWQLTPRGSTVYSHTKLLPPEVSGFSDDIWKTSIKIRRDRNIHLNILCENSDLALDLQSTDQDQNRKTIILEEDDLEIAPFEIIAFEGVVMELTTKNDGHLAILSNSPTFAMTAYKRLRMLWNFHEQAAQ